MLKDFLVALRRLARRPSFTVPAVAALAIGIGATTAIFSAVNAALLRPLPYPSPDDLYVLRTARTDGGWSSGAVSSAELSAVASGARAVMAAAGAGVESTDVILVDDGRNRQVGIRSVTDGFFELAGAPMALGRGSAIEARDGSFGGVVVSYRIWEQVFAKDPEIIGRTLRLAAGPATVIGVAPADFDLTGGTDVWLVESYSPTSDVTFDGFVRVQPGTDPAELRSQLGAVMGSRAQDGLETRGRAFVAIPLLDSMVGDLAPILWIVLAAAAVLLMLGCVNVSALILARGRAQAREFAIRKALGAAHAGVARQLLVESLLLSGAGTAIGLLLADGGLRALSTAGLVGLPRLDRVPIDETVLIVAVVILVATAAVVGLLPMMRLARSDIRSLLGGATRPVAGEGGPRGMMSVIVIAEIAMAIVLVTSAGWLVRSYANLTDVDPGFVPESRLVFRTALLGSSYMPILSIGHGGDGTFMIPDRTGNTPAAWLRDLTTQLRLLEEVQAVGIGSAIPFRRGVPGVQFVSVPGVLADPDAPEIARSYNASPEFFDAMGMRLLAGRGLSDSDPPNAVVVNEAFVRAYLPSRDPVGVTFTTGFQPGTYTIERSIVGVVADVRDQSLREADSPSFYGLSYYSRGFVVVSTSLSDPAPLIPAVRAAVSAVDPGVPVTIEPFTELMSAELARHRLGFLLMSLFSFVSLLLAGIGILGVVGHGTSLRSTEFAVRIAVGAKPAAIVWSVLRVGGVRWLFGTLIGVGLAVVMGRLGSTQLYQVQGSDPAILGVAVAAVSAVTFAAYAASALRGSRVEAGKVLRAE